MDGNKIYIGKLQTLSSLLKHSYFYALQMTHLDSANDTFSYIKNNMFMNSKYSDS